MYPKLTYILILIALLASSCNSDTSDDTSLTKGAELSFDVSDFSRGSVTTSINQFLVYGDTKPISSGASNPVVLFNKTKVEFKNNNWIYDGTQFWIPNYEHSFVALSPVEIFEGSATPRYINSQLSFEYSIPAPGGLLSSTGNVADILLATHRRFYKDMGFVSNLDNKITFKFSHLLSLINFAPAFSNNLLSSDAYIEVYKLELSGIKTKAQFNIVPAQRLSNNETDDMTVDITPKEGGNIAIEFSSPIRIGNNAKNVNLFADNDAMIMLPQAFSADSNAIITLSYTLNGDSTLRQAALSMNNLKWDSGKSYLYKFTIETTGAKFDNCEINPWNVKQGEEITVE